VITVSGTSTSPRAMGTPTQATNGTAFPAELSKPSRGGSPSRKQVRVVAIVTAIVVVGIVLLASGIVPGFGPSSKATSPTLDTEAQAVAAAHGITSSVAGGPWSLSFAQGLAFTVPVTDRFPVVHNCTANGTTTVNASAGPFPGDYSAGVAVLWVLGYSSPTTESGGLQVEVEDGVASDLGVGPVCSGSGSIPPLGSVIDSSTAVQSVLATTNGSLFLRDASRANVSLLLANDGSSPVWDIQFGACDYLTIGPGLLLASVWAVNGTIDQAPRGYVPC